MVAYLVELKPSGGVWHIEIERTSDCEPMIQGRIEWSLANRIDKEEQILPESLFRVLKERVAIAENHEKFICNE